MESIENTNIIISGIHRPIHRTQKNNVATPWAAYLLTELAS